MNKYLKTFFKAILAGGAISLGCMANICSQNKIAGSLFFVIGLFFVLTYDLDLFTGRICFLLDKEPSYIITLIVIYFGNLMGALIFGILLGSIDKFIPLLAEYSIGLQARISGSAGSTLALGYLCNICIYIAVNGYKRSGAHQWESFLALVLGVSVFVVCGFEHSIADMIYITMCGLWSWKAIGFIGLVTIGNILGALMLPILNKSDILLLEV